eukprot:15471185-Alexandrium_andersonii.AAC.1
MVETFSKMKILGGLGSRCKYLLMMRNGRLSGWSKGLKLGFHRSGLRPENALQGNPAIPRSAGWWYLSHSRLHTWQNALGFKKEPMSSSMWEGAKFLSMNSREALILSHVARSSTLHGVMSCSKA